AVAGVDVRVGLPTRADALHPVPHVGGGGRIAARVRGGLHGGNLGELHRGQEVGLHAHLGRHAFRQAAGGRDLVRVEIQHPGVGVVQLLRAARGVRHARRVYHLEALGGIVERPVLEDDGGGVPVLAAVLPQVEAAV